MPKAALSPKMRALLLSAPPEVVNELAIVEDRAIRAEERSEAAERKADVLRGDVARLRAENESMRELLNNTLRDLEAGLARALVKAAGG